MLRRVTGATVRGADRSLGRQAVRVESFVERSSAPLVIGAITIVAALVWGRYMGRIDQWLVQTDELLFVRLAMGMADSLSLDATLRGQPVSNWNLLYPLVIAPLYGLLGTDAAFKAAHWLNAFVMASTAIPVYLTARGVGVSKLAGYLAAGLSVCIPWLALGDMLRDDVVAYPAFAWAVLAMHRAIAEPTPRRDLLAVVAIVLAASARTQLIVLAPAFVLAIALHEGLFAYAAHEWSQLAGRLRRHWMLLGAGLVIALYRLVGGGEKLLGPYQETTGAGDLLPIGLVGNLGMHLSMVAVGIGVIPVTFAAGWAIGTLVRPGRRDRHAFAVLALVAGSLTFVGASSFVLRNAGGHPFDRYFFYIVPLALVGMVVCIDEGRRRWLPAAAAALFFAWIAGRGVWDPVQPPYHQSPVSALNWALDYHAGRIGLSAPDAARWGGLALALAAALALRLLPGRVLLPVLAAGLLLFGAFETRYVFRSMEATQLGPRPQNLPSYDRDWIDTRLPKGAGVALMPDIPMQLPPGDPNVNDWVTTSLWWDTEFFNERVADVYVNEADPPADPTPFPKRYFTVNERTGSIDLAGLPASQQQPYVVLDGRRSDLRPAGELVEQTPWGLHLIRAERPFRTPWAVFGLGPGDVVYAGEPVRIRLFEEGPAKVTLSLMVPYQTTPQVVERRYTLAGDDSVDGLRLTSGKMGELSVCLDGPNDTGTLRMSHSPVTEQPSRLFTTVVEPTASC
jgi:hypothetical protein